MTDQTTNPARVAEISITPQPPALVLFGRDNAGKPRAAWFDATEADVARMAATTMRLRAVPLTLIEEVAFAPLEQRLARRLLMEADQHGIVGKTHQQLAADVGSVREVVSRILAQWAESGLVALRRGQVQIEDRAALAALRPQ